MITPAEITTKAKNAYEKKFLPLWIRGDAAGFFPLRIPANLKLSAKDIAGTIGAVDKLRNGSKESRGRGYTVHWEEVNLRDFGRNQKPQQITIDTLDDLLTLAGSRSSFEATQQVAAQIRAELPALEDWLVQRVRSLDGLLDSIDGLIAVAHFFIANPWPDCFSRQIPVAVDTKFVERNESVLRQWLRLLLPGSAIDVNETAFANQFGLRDKETHRGIRLLDRKLLTEMSLPFAEMSLPVRLMAQFAVQDATVVVVENRLNLFTLPEIERGIGIQGEGKAVTRLRKLEWPQQNRLLYWGDIDVDGFEILASLRSVFPHAESLLMDEETLNAHVDYQGSGNGRRPAQPANLTSQEAAAFVRCAEGNIRLEQERIPQNYCENRMRTVVLGGQS